MPRLLPLQPQNRSPEFSSPLKDQRPRERGRRPRMSWSEDWDRKDEMPVDERLKVLAAAAGEPKRKRPRPCDVAVGVAGGGRPAASGSASVEKEEPSSGAAAASRVRPESAAAATMAVAVEDTDALDCGVCFLPLKPPIFQCAVGHVVCSPCHDKLEATAKSYVCGDATGGYQRCYAMERMVESVRVPHAPCSYPGSKDNGFVGSSEAILDHFTGVNNWPFTTKIRAENLEMCSADLYDGFSFLVADHTPDDQAECYPSESIY
ncbi:hypothetical protein GQ55_3G118700 [Panicum hallii var. hallii]|uniref:E3 ubiquitin-protein ligase Sina-like RING finger domain-containing protein n=1 Tax=Panicum hallii var. hallii TaxID=1504633 RepID=A0A2T7E8H1_9POAL|nr:hypothetical protein GQ55_3G118700 [Panicum hallii var. hallii]